eukprot:CAMPEP_0181174472 /NCGR_PEP_ID=MMETSP1096-20121128/3555_1 /TAXON_ID=156174 ORGANISM="Chrysochromulina ericina, Strain CCMP281" /NCGR_SAMPLE_ID=MMETSP1096 /ASSEMBLY_ACC=CAM_ASM_000453 /LENGTH=492 /DNA_ID=CAMNT_0023262377 /DNA_START=76 /DNA_END=1555 /DNA_ORIENTATION=+
MTSGNLASWKKNEGETIDAGDVIAEVETDKATVDYEAVDEGVLAKILVSTGAQDVEVHTAANASTLSHDDLWESCLMEEEEGETVDAGDVIAEVETDKATVDYEAVDEGVLAKILVSTGAQDVEVGTPIAVIVDSVDSVVAFKDFVLPAAGAPAVPPAAPTPAPSTAAAAPATTLGTSATPFATSSAAAPLASAPATGGVVPASPLAKMMAAQKGISLPTIRGTGPGGRVIAADVLEAQAVTGSEMTDAATAAAAQAEPGEAFVDIPNSNIRKVTARRMVENKATAPHYYLTMEVAMDELMALRAQVNAAQGTKTSVNDYVVKACARALLEVPGCNTSYTEEYIRQYASADISVAVSTERGLITPIVFGAESKSVTAISSDIKMLASKAKEGKLAPSEFIGGTFTVSNLGMFGLKQFTAIINGPQACILAVGGAEKKVVPNEGADAAVRPFATKTVMCVTLSADHRVVDGALGSEWLQSFKKHIENPVLLLL